MKPVIPKVEMVQLKDLKPYVKNPKDHPEEQIDRIAKSIQVFGWIKNIVVSKDLEILAGHGAVLAAEKLGLTKIPASIADHLSPEEARAYRIADNKSAESEWIKDFLHEEVKLIRMMMGQEGSDDIIEALGFSKKQLDEMIEETRQVETKQGAVTLFPFTLLLTKNQREDVIKAFSLAKKTSNLRTHNELFMHLIKFFLDVRKINYAKV